jgi:photosystem II stability/assembly factor-like uncharacterized protein
MLSVLFALVLLALPDPNADLLHDLKWRNIGPAIMGGRIDDIEAIESDPETIYAGAATGGVWKTTNGGTTWAPIFDDYGTTSIGDVAIAASNPKVVWVGTGEANNRQSSSWGNGIYKSADGGATFTRMGLEDSHHIGRIVIDPKNPDVVYVAALGHLWGPNKTRGLYKTIDGGRTWTLSKFIDENTGFVDVAMDPSDSRILYAAAYQRQRTSWGMNGGGPGSGLYKTSDAGKTWTRLEGGLPSGGDTGRIGIAVYAKNPAVVYVTYEHKDGGIFRSDDRGKTWRKVNALNPRPLYFSQIRIDPLDDQRIYVLGTSLFVSDDGGKTFRSDGARNVHVDHHAMWIDPHRPKSIWLGNDGGLWQSRDRAQTWIRFNNIPLGQFYVVGADMNDPYNVYGGLQDNGVWAGPSATRHRVGPLNDDWIQVNGGDGMFVTADPLDPTTVYIETQDGSVRRFDRASGESKGIRPLVLDPSGQAAAPAPADATPRQAAGGLRFNWTTPVVISPHNSRTVYIAGHRLWRSLDRGERWTAISPDLSKQIDREKLPIMGVVPSENTLGRHDGVTSYGNATTMAESPVEPGLLVVGTDDGNVQMSKDGGASWTDLTRRITGVPEKLAVAKIELSRFDAKRMFVAFDGHRSDDFAAYIFRSDDAGETWKRIVEGLPQTPVRTLKEDLRNPDLVFAGTERGVWMSLTRGDSWTAMKNALPDVPVFDIEIHPRERELILGTHGRSVYVMNIAPLEDLTPAVMAKPVHLFAPRPAVSFNVLEHRDFNGQAAYIGANPPFGTSIDYWFSQVVENASISILDGERVVRTLTAPTTPGLHRVQWDLRWTPPPQPARNAPAAGVIAGDPRPAESTLARVAGDYGGGGDPTGGEAGAPPSPTMGPVVAPGTYTVVLTAQAVTPAKAPLTVRGDTRLAIAEEDRRAHADAQLRGYEAQLKGIPANNRATDLNTQMTAVTKAIAGIKDISGSVKTSAEDIAKKIRDVQGRISRATATITTTLRELSASTSRPGDVQHQQLTNAIVQLESAIPQLEALVQSDVPAFNQKLDAGNVPASVPRLKPN